MSEPVNGLGVGLGVSSVINLAQITVHPVQTVGAPQVLWTAQSVLRLAPGQTRVVYANYVDSNGERVGAVDVAELVAGTDYQVNDEADGSGFDYTSAPSVSVSGVAEATRMAITLGSTAVGALYVTLLQVRGKPLRVYDAVTVEKADTDSQAAYEKRSVELDLAMQPDPTFAQSYCEYLVGRFATPSLMAATVTIRDRAVFGSANVFGLELFDKVIVNDEHVGLETVGHWIRAISVEIVRRRWEVVLHLEAADERKYWLLGRAGFGRLDSETRLAF